MTSTPPSTPPSPSSPAQQAANNSLSDIFSDSPPSSPTRTGIPSDITRLHSIHATAGYREGISSSKARSLQPGFDEGYSLGATFGMQVGYILGALEGLCRAFYTPQEEHERWRSLLRQARAQLEIQKIFAKDYWDTNGIWTYEIIAKGEEPVFPEIVAQHPLIRKWNQTLKEETRRAGVVPDRFEGSEWEAGRI